MFFAFCGVCLFLGILNICATGWFGSVIETATSNKDGSDSMNLLRRMDQSSHEYGYQDGGGHVEQTIMMASGVNLVVVEEISAEVSGSDQTVRITVSALSCQKFTKSWT